MPGYEELRKLWALSLEPQAHGEPFRLINEFLEIWVKVLGLALGIPLLSLAWINKLSAKF